MRSFQATVMNFRHFHSDKASFIPKICHWFRFGWLASHLFVFDAGYFRCWLIGPVFEFSCLLLRSILFVAFSLRFFQSSVAIVVVRTSKGRNRCSTAFNESLTNFERPLRLLLPTFQLWLILPNLNLLPCCRERRCLQLKDKWRLILFVFVNQRWCLFNSGLPFWFSLLSRWIQNVSSVWWITSLSCFSIMCNQPHLKWTWRDQPLFRLHFVQRLLRVFTFYHFRWRAWISAATEIKQHGVLTCSERVIDREEQSDCLVRICK